MIEQRATDLAVLITRQRELKIQLRLLDGFRAQADEVRRIVESLDGVVRTWKLFERRGVGDPTAPLELDSLIADLKELLRAFQADPSYILGANRLHAVKKGVPGLVAQVGDQLRLRWRAYAAVMVPTVNEEVLSVLAKIAARRQWVARVQNGLRSLSNQMVSLPATDADIDAYRSEAEKVQKAWDDFDSTHLPPEVLLFLKEAGSAAGASVATLTAPVQQWLTDNDLAGAFRIRQAVL